MDSKTHLHVYSKSNDVGQDGLALPYHTDNGLYLLITPSSHLPLLSVGRDGTVHQLDTGNNTLILMLGTGLSSWLLRDEGLHSPPHAVPSLPTNSVRIVVARMTVASPNSTPQHDTTTNFWTHFSAPLQSETGHTLARLRVQRKADECQDWPHECTHDREARQLGVNSFHAGCANGYGLNCNGAARLRPCWEECVCRPRNQACQ